jgi:hypothetical protein
LIHLLIRLQHDLSELFLRLSIELLLVLNAYALNPLILVLRSPDPPLQCLLLPRSL